MTRPSKSSHAALGPRLRRRLLQQVLTEIGPLMVFFLGFLIAGLVWATAAYAVATAASFLVAWRSHSRLPVLPAVTALLVLVFAALTVTLDDSVFIKIKPTVVNGFYGLVLGLGWLAGFRLVARVLGPEMRLDEAGQRRITIVASLYLFGLAAANEVAWRLLDTEHWVLFKVFVLTACNLAFLWSQLPVLRRHMVRGPEANPDPADPSAAAAAPAAPAARVTAVD